MDILTDEKSLVQASPESVAVAAREEGEIKAIIVLARQFPRNENAAVAKMLKSSERPAFANAASYSYPRGGANVTGPSVRLARDMARCWGNIRYGIRIVSETDESMQIKGYAYDAESNAYIETEARFKKLIYRKPSKYDAGGWRKPDERELREFINKHGAIAERNALLKIMPPDVVDEILAACKTTLEKAAAGELKGDNRQKTIRSLCKIFLDFGISVVMLETYLGHPVDQLNEAEAADLIEIRNAIRDGQSKPSDYFSGPRDDADKSQAERIADRVAPPPAPGVEPPAPEAPRRGRPAGSANKPKPEAPPAAPAPEPPDPDAMTDAQRKALMAELDLSGAKTNGEKHARLAARFALDSFKKLSKDRAATWLDELILDNAERGRGTDEIPLPPGEEIDLDKDSPFGEEKI